MSRARAAAVLAGLVLAVVIAAAGQAPAADKGKLQTIESRLDRIERALRPLERKAAKFRRFMGCIDEVRVSELGDRDRRFGYHYDEGDGGGLSFRPALAVDRRRKGVPDFRFLDFPSSRRCESDTTQIGTPEQPGTADPARNAPRETSGVGQSTARLERLEDRAERVERASERFDDWESCLTAVPVTEYGDPDGRYGFLFNDPQDRTYLRAAIAIDTSPWDDPDYLLLAFAGNDDPEGPGNECGTDPGEGVDRALAAGRGGDAVEDLLADADSLLEEVADLSEPISEFTVFDECVYQLGVDELGRGSGASGFLYGDSGRPRAALAYEAGDSGQLDFEFLVTPGEEPPSIECNEDASGESTDE